MFGSLRLVLSWPQHINSWERDNMSWPRDHFVKVMKCIICVIYYFSFHGTSYSVVFMSDTVNYDILHVIVFLPGKPTCTRMLWIFFSLFISL